MKSRALTCIFAMTLFGALAFPVRLAAQEQKVEKGHHRYKLIDLGTFGGPASYFSGGGIGNLVLNNEGIVAGYADTSAPDPYAPNCFNPDCFLSHTFRWQNGVLTDLGALPGTNSSAASGINSRGWIAGYSENGVIDPLTGFPETNAALWKDGQIINLGTLGGNESLAISVKNGGQVVGLATINRTPDPFSFLGAPTPPATSPIRSFIPPALGIDRCGPGLLCRWSHRGVDHRSRKDQRSACDFQDTRFVPCTLEAGSGKPASLCSSTSGWPQPFSLRIV